MRDWASRAGPFFLGCGLLAGARLHAGEPEPASSSARTLQVIAGPEYQAGGFHRFIFGSGYRTLWTTPIEVEVLDLESFSGGLTAEKKGGGRQTQSLTFEGADGREWKFRSIDKDPTAVLPKALQNSFVDQIAQDQISASLPANATVVDALTDALGILHVNRRLFVLPDSPRLGEFREEFAGMLGTLEEKPSVEPPVTPGFAGYRGLVDMEELEKQLDAGARERVDSRAFLKARLFDMLIGDYDRHKDQWDWAREEDSGRWIPVPKDRDLAFVKFDGLLLDLIRPSQPRLVDFEDSYPSILGLTWQARFLDRRHLADLDWPAWAAVAEEMWAQLTDPVIDAAAARLLPPYYRLHGPTLAAQLKARRQGLPVAARRFYTLLAREAEVHGTDEADSLQILRQRDGAVEVVVAGSSGVYFRRRFDPLETDEVRVFLKGGDDRGISEGQGSPGVKVRLVGGEGNDLLDDSAGGYTRFYDSRGQNRVVKGRGTKEDSRPHMTPLDAAGNPVRDWGGATGMRPWIRAGGEYGLILGAVLERTGYGFRKHPYAHRHTLHLGYSTGLETGGARYNYESLRTDNRARVQVEAKVSALDVIHYYGFGNETGDPQPDDFYDVRQTQFAFAPSYRLDLASIDVSIGPVLKYANTGQSSATLLGQEQPYGADRFGQAGAWARLVLDRRDRESAPSRGAFFCAEGSFYPKLWSVSDAFGEVHGHVTTYATAPLPLEPSLALRAGGHKVWGRYPFQEAATIGGGETVRGLRRQRYAGDASVYGNAELRLLLARREGAGAGRFGIFGLADAGRVFLRGESSDRWHTAVGGGLWLSVAKAENVVSLAVARSEGRVQVYLRGGFAF
jgi:hypothetical protein